MIRRRKNTEGMTMKGTVNIIGRGPKTWARIAAPEVPARQTPKTTCQAGILG
jgi:hypothetical protein